MTDEPEMLLALLAGSVVKLTALAWMTRSRETCVGRVSRLHVYPLKSARELSCDIPAVTLSKYGIMYSGAGDRQWLVTNKGDMVTMKQNARLTLISTSLEGEALRLDADGMEPLRLPLNPTVEQDRVSNVTVKMTPLPALDLGDAAAAWVAKVIQQPGIRLHYSAPALVKRLSCKVHKDWPTLISKTDEIAFQDFCHCMIMTESSMTELSNRLQRDLSIIPFRPNVMVDGNTPYDEDNWREIRFGQTATVRYVDHCTRCLITTIDHKTAEKDKDGQPLTELKRYRCMPPYGPKPCMGIHTVVKTEGEIRVGDPVYVIRK